MTEPRPDWTGEAWRILLWAISAFVIGVLVFPPDSIVHGWPALFGLCLIASVALRVGKRLREN
jgi:hypothetical protein